MDFEQIEDLLPDGAFTIGSGHTCVTAQWLHDFARNIAAAEREACAALAEEHLYQGPDFGELAREIRKRSNYIYTTRRITRLARHVR